MFILDQEVEGDKYNQSFSPIGFSLLMLSLLMDGFTGAIQDKLLKDYKTSPYRTMFYSNVWSTLFILIAALFTGELYSAIDFIVSYPEVLVSLTILSLCNPIGQFFIYATIHHFGSLTNSTITTARKFVSILLSVFLFGHPLSSLQWISVVIVFVGLSLNVILSDSTKHKQTPKDKKE